MPDFSVFNLLTAAAWLNAGLWLVALAMTWRGLRSQQPLPAPADDALTHTDAPLVSILVPARNEAGRALRASLNSMLAQDYGNFEVVAVNDRSEDATGDILRELAQASHKLIVVEGAEMPAGWLGKPHAMAQAVGASRGEWLLATDADMIFAPAALRTVTAYATAHGFDAVTLLPHVVCGSFWERVFLPVFGWAMLVAMPVSRVNNPRRRESAGVGGFFLMRREALEKVGGYAAVRAEVAEDLRLGALLKESGARLRLESGEDLISTRMQTNLRDLWDGFTKNMFAGMQFKLLPTLAGGASMALFAALPVFAAAATFAAGGAWVLWLPCVLVWLWQAAIFALVNRRWGVPVVYALTMPLGFALFDAVLLNSAWRILSRRGVTWKGREIYGANGVRPPIP
jgi:chlorobactene glucosyltransferase